MRNSWLIFAFLIVYIKTNAAISKLKADCQTHLCSCTDKTDQIGSIEFRVICNGNGTQDIIMDDEIFKNETKIDFARKVYVRMTNFSTLFIDNSFLSRWQAYTSCSFDIWACPNTLFSSDAILKAKYTTDYHAFAGIGVINSSVNAFPPMIFRAKNEVGLKLVRSQLTHLDVVSLGALKVNYLIVNDSIIGKIGGSNNDKIKLAYSLKYNDAEVHMQNVKIGIIAKGGLAFSDYDSRMAKVELNRLTVGFLDEGSISIGRKVSVRITQSNIGLISPKSFSVKESGKLTMERNVLMVKKLALGNIICNEDIKILNNILLPEDMFKNCSLDKLNNSTSCEEINDFIDQSCHKNHLLSFEEEKDEPVASTIRATIPTTNNPLYDSTSILEVENMTKEIQLQEVEQPKAEQLHHNGVPMGIFYLTIGLCLALLVMVMVLTAMVAWGKMSNKTYKPKDNARNSGCYDDYDESTVAYFAPTVPLPVSLRKNSIDDINKDHQYYEN